MNDSQIVQFYFVAFGIVFSFFQTIIFFSLNEMRKDMREISRTLREHLNDHAQGKFGG